MGGSLPFRSGVVVSLRPLSVCHGSLWLVTALFPSLSLYLPVPIFSWLLLLLRQVPWVCCLAFPMVVRTLTVGPGVSYASCRFSWRPGADGALAVTLPEAASQREFFPLCLVLPFPGSVTFSRVCSSVGVPVGVAHSFDPSLLLGGNLVRFCGGLC